MLQKIHVLYWEVLKKYLQKSNFMFCEVLEKHEIVNPRRKRKTYLKISCKNDFIKYEIMTWRSKFLKILVYGIKDP